MKKKVQVCKRVTAWLASPLFFRITVGFFLFEAAWIALTGNYPMAFDENYHMGLIRLYAEHATPFWEAHPAGGEVYGALTRDPSYLYQYVMSFPYRLINFFTHDLMLQVLLLRGLNIGLFAATLSVYRRLLLKTGASAALTHACLLVFVLIPVVPLLAAQVNYDNLFVLLVGLLLFWTADFSNKVVRNRPVPLLPLLAIMTLGLFASLVKYAFLPIFAAVMAYIVLIVWRVHRKLPEIGRQTSRGVREVTRPAVYIVIAGLVLATGLCMERYGINMVRYHTPVPDCAKVLTVAQCSAYGPWLRDHDLALQKTGSSDGAFVYMREWLHGMWVRLFFAVDGPATSFQTRGPLTIPGQGAIVLAVTGVLLALMYGRRVFARYNKRVLGLLLSVALIYLVVLWLDGFEGYRRTGKAVAINGRYLLPILPFLFIFSGLAVSVALRHWQQQVRLKLALAFIIIIVMLWGGGALTYILRSNDTWYWPTSSLRGANHVLQRTVGPITPGYNRPTQYLH